MTPGHRIILVHGFFRTRRDMRFLADHFRRRGFRTSAFTLPATFGSLADCVEQFGHHMEALSTGGETLHFIGHSMGGLIIRAFLAETRVPRLGRCVFIATPHQGTPLVDRLLFCRPLSRLVKPLASLGIRQADMSAPLNTPPPEIGCIAGNKNSLLAGSWLLPAASDGRVPVASARFPQMKDFVVLPYHHNQIHHKVRTAELCRVFLTTGRFDLRSNHKFQASNKLQ